MRTAHIITLAGLVAAQKGRHSTEPVYSCPLGYDLIGKTCEKNITEEPRIVCAEGTLQGYECIVENKRSAKCPIGTMPQGKQCVQTIQTAPGKVCPVGFYEGFNGCEIQEQLPLVEVCEIGSREGPQCATIEVAQYQIQQFCPAGFDEAAKGGCWRTSQYDCTPFHAGKGGNGLRGLIGKDGMSLPVNPKSQILKQTCERKEGAAYVTEKSCPAGFTDTGSGCFIKNLFPTVTKCSNGGPLETCYATRSASYDLVCAQGTTLQGGLCIQTLSLPEETFCASGYDNGFACVETFAPHYVCPAGLTLSGHLCLGRETAEPQVTVTVTCQGKNCHH